MFEGYRKIDVRELQLLLLDTMDVIHEVCIKNDIEYYIIGGNALGAVRHKGFLPWDDDIDIAMTRDNYNSFKQLFYSEFDQSKYFLQDYDTDIDYDAPLMRFCIKDTILDWESMRHLKYCKNIFIDIFPLDNVPNDKEEAAKQAKEISQLKKYFYYRYPRYAHNNSKLEKITKCVIGKLLSVVPSSKLFKRRLDIMTRFDASPTDKLCSMASQYSYTKQAMPKEFYGKPTLVEFEGRFYYAPEKINAYLTQLFGANYLPVPPKSIQRQTTPVYIKTKNKDYSVGYYACDICSDISADIKHIKKAFQYCEYLFVGLDITQSAEFSGSDWANLVNQKSATLLQMPEVNRLTTHDNLNFAELWNDYHFQVYFGKVKCIPSELTSFNISIISLENE